MQSHKDDLTHLIQLLGGLVGILLGGIALVGFVHLRLQWNYHSFSYAAALAACQEDMADMCSDWSLTLYGTYILPFLLGGVAIGAKTAVFIQRTYLKRKG